MEHLPQILKPTEKAIKVCTDHMLLGGVVAIPTETVYGLAAEYGNRVGVNLVYKIKNRPKNNPLIVHVEDVNMASDFVDINSDTEKIMSFFWPGPLTLILKKTKKETIAIRSPKHQVCKQVFKFLKKPFVAPSANPSGYISPTSAQHVYNDFKHSSTHNKILILDGGVCSTGLESTILDLTGGLPTIVRPGVINQQEIEAVIGRVLNRKTTIQTNSPGTSLKHYSPKKPTYFVKGKEDLGDISKSAIIGCDVKSTFSWKWPNCPKKAEGLLYEVLRKADNSGSSNIIIISPPNSPGWEAVLDRIFRATTGLKKLKD